MLCCKTRWSCESEVEIREAGCSRGLKCRGSGCRDGRKRSELLWLWRLRTPGGTSTHHQTNDYRECRSLERVAGNLLLDPPTLCLIATSGRMGAYLGMLFRAQSLDSLCCDGYLRRGSGLRFVTKFGSSESRVAAYDCRGQLTFYIMCYSRITRRHQTPNDHSE